MRFTDRTVIVTGAAGGIGRAIVDAFADEGGQVVLVDRDGAACEAHAEAARARGGRVHVCVADLLHDDVPAMLVAEALTRTGRLDVVVNNAAVMPHRPLALLTADDWTVTLTVNLVAPARLIGAALPRMRSGGTIVNIASVHAFRAQAYAAAYAASKAGLLAVTRAADLEGRARGIRVNAIVPGAINSGLLWSNPAVASGEEYLDPADVGTPRDVASAVAFLASDDASFIRGAALAVDGGRLAQL
jgi:NAD(P)-dependent dehydrogenase (short-subunit alcohol dehydrogenase family)